MAPGLSGAPSDRLRQLGLTLPPAAVNPPGVVLSYCRLVRSGNIAYLSGHLPAWGPELRFQGRVGHDITIDQAVEAARLTALSMLRTIQDELGSFDRVTRWLRVTGFVRAVADFDRQPAVLNGFTNLVSDLWGAEHLPSRSAVGVADLPFGVCVEADAAVEVAD